MADTKLSALTELAATPATDDELYIRDVSELAVDESKRITVANLLAGLADDAVTNAKLANMAVDTVKGRVTAGTGDPEDVATTGSGNVVRATSPTLVTPALGTPASGVMTNVTGVPTAGLVDAAVTYAKMQDVSATARVLGRVTAGAGDVEEVVIGTAASQVAAGDHTHAGGTTLTVKIVANYETLGRYAVQTFGAGSVTFSNVYGATITSGATDGGKTVYEVTHPTGKSQFDSPAFTTHLYFRTAGTDFNTFFGMTVTGMFNAGTGAVSYTANHIGFKITRAASGTINLYATQADGTTETASASLTTIAAGDDIDLILKVNGTTSVDYYWRKNATVGLSAATNLTTNMPTTSIDNGFYSLVSNAAVASTTTVDVISSSYER